MKKVVLYIVYGESQKYYDEANFSILTFKNWLSNIDLVEIVVLTEKPEQFESCEVKIIKMSKKQKKEWSLNGKYHFRIKNRGLGYVMDKLKLDNNDKILFFDTDTYFHTSPLKLFNLIKPNQALLYLNEGLVYKRKRFDVYVKNLEGKFFEVEGHSYKLSKNSSMWGSLMIGIMPNMRHSLEWADKLMLKFYEIIPAHTIEEFSLSESLSMDYKLTEGKNYVSLYSTSRKKEHAMPIITEFLNKCLALPLNEQINLAQKVIIKRSAFKVIKQRILHFLS